MINGTKIIHIINRYNEFLQHNVSKDGALYITRLMFELTSTGFERYISAYFHKIEGYKTNVIGGLLDHGIDIEGEKTLGHQTISLAIQCKKRTRSHIKKKEILNFEYDLNHWNKNGPHTQNAFLTTNWASDNAKNIAHKHNINLIDCFGLIRFKDEYSLDEFENEFMKGDIYRRIKLFTKIDVNKLIVSQESNNTLTV